ncbi:hypothetical protein BGW39_010392 [Mortierella sp. 14UC]|nr:hypothetical protein BGW39_010392 [Mortierella sp. 14UC]
MSASTPINGISNDTSILSYAGIWQDTNTTTTSQETVCGINAPLTFAEYAVITAPFQTRVSSYDFEEQLEKERIDRILQSRQQMTEAHRTSPTAAPSAATVPTLLCQQASVNYHHHQPQEPEDIYGTANTLDAYSLTPVLDFSITPILDRLDTPAPQTPELTDLLIEEPTNCEYSLHEGSLGEFGGPLFQERALMSTFAPVPDLSTEAPEPGKDYTAAFQGADFNRNDDNYSGNDLYNPNDLDCVNPSIVPGPCKRKQDDAPSSSVHAPKNPKPTQEQLFIVEPNNTRRKATENAATSNAGHVAAPHHGPITALPMLAKRKSIKDAVAIPPLAKRLRQVSAPPQLQTTHCEPSSSFSTSVLIMRAIDSTTASTSSSLSSSSSSGTKGLGKQESQHQSPRNVLHIINNASDQEAASEQSAKKKTKAEAKTFACPYAGCGRVFPRKFNLNSHLVTHNPDVERPFKCEESGCDKAFVREGDLNRHQSVHQQASAFHCSTCNTGFARKDTLLRHYQRTKTCTLDQAIGDK